MMRISHRTAGQVDEASAATAKQHSALFQALIMEPFYPVHAKAQRRVPDPEGVDPDDGVGDPDYRPRLRRDALHDMGFDQHQRA